MAGQVVDTVTAEEFMQQTLQKISHEEMRAIGLALDAKAKQFRALFAPGATLPGDAELREILRAMFGVRRKADAILETLGGDGLRAAIERLTDPGTPIEPRIDEWTEALSAFPTLSRDIGTQILHLSDPERYWLWTTYMWDPRTETGSLRLVTMEEFDLFGETPGQTYMKVGEAVAFVNETGRAVGFTDIGAGPFGIDVFLACVYGIYMYTVLRMRMTQEFNHVVPQLPELARRLLGVYQMEA